MAVTEHDITAAQRILAGEGSLNLWETAFVTAASLQTLPSVSDSLSTRRDVRASASLQALREITDPFPERNKLLCLRYVRLRLMFQLFLCR